MAKKKKKNADFQKIKLKVGKKLPKHLTNDTRPEIRTKKIQINSSLESIDPIKLLSNPSINTKCKLIYLNKYHQKISSLSNENDSRSILNGEHFKIIGKYLTDHDHRVRSEVLKILRILLRLIQNNSDNNDNNNNNIDESKFSPLLSIIMTYINCGITHIDKNIQNDSEILLSFIIEKFNDISMTQQLMQLFIKKINSSMFRSLNDKFYSLLRKFVDKLEEQSNKIESSDDKIIKKPIEFTWKENQMNILYLHDDRFELLHSKINTFFDLTFQNNFNHNNYNNISQEFHEIIKKMIINDIKSMIGKGSNRTISSNDMNKIIDCIKIMLKLKYQDELFQFWNYDKKNIPHITIIQNDQNHLSNNSKKRTKKLSNQHIVDSQAHINGLLKKLKNSCNNNHDKFSNGKCALQLNR